MTTVHRTDPAFVKFEKARAALMEYEKGHSNQSRAERLNDKEYSALQSTFSFADSAAAEAKFDTNG